MDTVDKATRSRIMAAVRSKNTAPEIEVRRSLFNLGYRYRLHVMRIPGRPDLVFAKYRTVVFVNGCFWHNHNCRKGSLPTTNRSWWESKLKRNAMRDVEVLAHLHKQAWRTIVVWECSLGGVDTGHGKALGNVAERIVRFLHSNRRSEVISGSRIGTIRAKQIPRTKRERTK